MKLEKVDGPILVQSSHIDLGEALTQHAREAILRTVSKYFGRLRSATVHFRHEGASYCCTIEIQIGALPRMVAEASHRDIYRAFDGTLDKVAKQLRRTKRELREDKGERVGKDSMLKS